ncbi:hypothetical protein CHGG_06403 [Chaetomium globosum CBS 148.51]|uniref:Calcineurin-like phosphoesterase domain-containing protein n=1 Tax=Chaetomium globosum (strain ATCC 6205 / CBS 148.51 / DSM 1962 / NBRC 6347 / NRRL 1970) TaxID=306901 RepID=Q2H4L2_CHAGB|nr:uncharacterized protein CHGG_06403 [Chaetomium globosum CBS 148.51]EAQ89784.1 hypothetical protein CHGG_06403 [Chaetomium globosum CBS 148.51]
MEYGTNKHPPFKDDPPLLVKDLPQEHIPSYTPPSLGVERINGKRLVVVGDVHGQTAALKALLEKIGFDHKHGDHLVLAGDMITKGPDSKGVVKLAMAVGASAVRGNQEDRVLAAARELHRWSAIDEFKSDRASEAEKADGEVGIETRRKNHAHRVAESLTRAQLAWLRSLPIILRIGHLPDAASPPWNASTLAVVHGGLVPGVHLEKQDPWAVMNMRSLKYPRKGKGGKKGKHHSESQPESPVDHDEDQTDPTTTTDGLTLTPDAVAVPVDTHGGEPWSHVLKKKQKGHRYAYGLDSGCGHGKQLTALVIEAVGDPAGRGAIRHHIEQVDCADPGVVVQTVEGLGGVEEGEEGSQRVME